MTALTHSTTLRISKQREYGTIHVHQRTSHFGFQMHVRLAQASDAVVFSLQSQDKPTAAGQFSVRVDLTTGEIWDAANETGLIGWLNQNLAELKNAESALLFRWEIEHHGGALIPRLQIGDEEWLYPAAPFSPDTHYSATAAGDTAQISKGYVWCQDRLSM